MVLQYGNIVKSVPKVGYVKSIDFWNIGCIGFIFATLIEFACLCHLSRSTSCQDKCSNYIDCSARIVYPICFVLFAMLYFYCSIHL